LQLVPHTQAWSGVQHMGVCVASIHVTHMVILVSSYIYILIYYLSPRVIGLLVHQLDSKVQLINQPDSPSSQSNPRYSARYRALHNRTSYNPRATWISHCFRFCQSFFSFIVCYSGSVILLQWLRHFLDFVRHFFLSSWATVTRPFCCIAQSFYCSAQPFFRFYQPFLDFVARYSDSTIFFLYWLGHFLDSISHFWDFIA
jgi:hypothetical protein